MTPAAPDADEPLAWHHARNWFDDIFVRREESATRMTVLKKKKSRGRAWRKCLDIADSAYILQPAAC